MKAFQSLIIRTSRALHPLLIVVLIIILNINWTLTLNAFDEHFKQVSGFRVIDLQNTGSILTAAEALAQMSAYDSSARTLYWVFFVLDNIMPPLVFGAFALLWAYFFRRSPNRLFNRLAASPILLIPFGVGFFDWIENLFFIWVVSFPAQANALTLLEIGLIVTRLKALCIFMTFGVTMALTLHFGVTSIRRLFARPAIQTERIPA